MQVILEVSSIYNHSITKSQNFSLIVAFFKSIINRMHLCITNNTVLQITWKCLITFLHTVFYHSIKCTTLKFIRQDDGPRRPSSGKYTALWLMIQPLKADLLDSSSGFTFNSSWTDLSKVFSEAQHSYHHKEDNSSIYLLGSL